MCDLLPYASYIVWLELIVALYPVRVIADGFPLAIQVFISFAHARCSSGVSTW